MLAQLKERASQIPRTTWIVAGIGVVALIIVMIALVIVDPLGGPFVTLDANKPAYIHPDGLAVSLTDVAGSVRVQVKTIPREAFIADSAGRQWVEAHKALPQNLTPLSPLYTVKTKGGAPVQAEMAIPNGAEPFQLLSLYSWDEKSKAWVFIPSTLDLSRQVIQFAPVGSLTNVMAVHAPAPETTVGVIASQGGPDLSQVYGLVLPEGITVSATGEISGSPAPATGQIVMPVITSRGSGFKAYVDSSLTLPLKSQLMPLLSPYQGFVLDFDNGQGYIDFVALIATDVHAQGKQIGVVIRGTDITGYEVLRLAPLVDHIWLAPGDNPTLYAPGGPAEKALAALVDQVDRSKAGLLINTLHQQVSTSEVKPVSPADIARIFGDIRPLDGYNSLLAPGESMAVRLSGSVQSMGYDQGSGMGYLTVPSGDGSSSYIYLSSASSLAQRLEMARQYRIGSVIIYGLAHPDAPQGLDAGISAFINQQPLDAGSPPQLTWRVTTLSGANVAEQSGDLSLIQYLWQAVNNPGDYEISAALKDQTAEQSLGKLPVQVGEVRALVTPTQTETPTSTARANAGTPRPAGTGTPAAQPTTAPVTGSIAAGAFELGGQTHTLAHPDKMHYAGMSWVKFQHKWNPGDSPGGLAERIVNAKAAGFKVLISSPGPNNPTSIDYAGYVSFMAGVAAAGADGVEIWNEMNFDREWPGDQISGANYVINMLAPAYQSIKAANPNTMVISGAPTPSGAFGGCGIAPTGQKGCDDWFYIGQMRDAGAANFADCIGVHFNSGATPPNATTGHPADGGDSHYSWYYSKMVTLYYGTFGKPLCFTELGYLTPQGYGDSLPGNFWWGGSTTLAEQAQWLSETAVMASQSGKVRLIVIFNVDFDVWEPNDPQAGYAIVRPDNTCPACDALHAVQP